LYYEDANNSWSCINPLYDIFPISVSDVGIFLSRAIRLTAK